MKLIILSIVLVGNLIAGNATHQELVQKLEQAVQLTASGRIQEGLNQIYAETPKTYSPKERVARTAKLSGTMEEIRQLGDSRRVNRLSVVFLGELCCRTRVLDRRDGGAVLWTFVCEKDHDEWVLVSVGLTANSEFGELLKELDAADYSKELPKEP